MKRMWLILAILWQRFFDNLSGVRTRLLSIIFMSLALSGTIVGLSTITSLKSNLPYYNSRKNIYQIVNNLKKDHFAEFIMTLERDSISHDAIKVETVDLHFDDSIPEEDRAYQKFTMTSKTAANLALDLQKEGRYVSPTFRSHYGVSDAELIDFSGVKRLRLFNFVDYDRVMIVIRSDIKWTEPCLAVLFIPQEKDQEQRIKQVDALFKAASSVDYPLELMTEGQYLEGALQTVYAPYRLFLPLGFVFLILQILFFYTWQMTLQKEQSRDLAVHYLNGRSEADERSLIIFEVFIFITLVSVIAFFLAYRVVAKLPTYFFETCISWPVTIIVLMMMLVVIIVTSWQRMKLAKWMEVLSCLSEETN